MKIRKMIIKNGHTECKLFDQQDWEQLVLYLIYYIIMFDDMVTHIITNKRFLAIIKELFI